MILVVMAAGMGSRFGGLKQLTPVGPNGEFLIDYSVYDAKQAGIEKIIFIIKEEHKELFEETIGNRIKDKIKVEYAYQKIDNIPQEFKVPTNRIKPWGTGHAILSAKDKIDNNFIVVNADDFYGRDSFIKLANYMKTAKENQCAMVGYKLKNTLSENGTVSRGICITDEQDNLKTITERTKIGYNNGELVYYEDDLAYSISPESIASCNLFGLTPKILAYASDYFKEFLQENITTEKNEFYLPTIVQKAISENKIKLKVLPTTSKFNGMTYKEDLEQLKENIKELINEGIYPENLWNK